MVCGSCRPPGSASPAEATVGLMIALLRGDWARADSSEPRHRVECSGLVAAYLQWHLEHGIRSLRHVEREGGGGPADEPGHGAGEKPSAISEGEWEASLRDAPVEIE
jgi:DNA repair protein RecO (recombination protein O)